MIRFLDCTGLVDLTSRRIEILSGADQIQQKCFRMYLSVLIKIISVLFAKRQQIFQKYNVTRYF